MIREWRCRNWAALRVLDALCRSLLRHERRVQRLENAVDARSHDDAKAQVAAPRLAFRTRKLTAFPQLQTCRRNWDELTGGALSHAIATAAATARSLLAEVPSVLPHASSSFSASHACCSRC